MAPIQDQCKVPSVDTTNVQIIPVLPGKNQGNPGCRACGLVAYKTSDETHPRCLGCVEPKPPLRYDESLVGNGQCINTCFGVFLG